MTEQMQQFADSGERREFQTGAVRDKSSGKGRFDLLQFRAIWEVAKVLERGAEKYDARNWEKGIPMSAFIDSGVRHLSRFMMDHQDEPHLAMACWNFLCALDTMLRIKEGKLPDTLWDVPVSLETVKDIHDKIKKPDKDVLKYI